MYVALLAHPHQLRRTESERVVDTPPENDTQFVNPDPKDARLQMEGGRFIQMDLAGTLYNLKKTLMQDVGFFERDFLYRAGIACARDSITTMFDKTLPADPRTALETLLEAYKRRGYGTFVIEEFDPKKMMTGIVSTDSAEAWAFQRNKDLQRRPVCAYTSGVLSYVCSVALLRNLHGNPGLQAHETECIGEGANQCKFVVGPAEELTKIFPDLDTPKDSFSEHELKLNEEILAKNLELQSLNLELERQVRKRTEEFWRSEENYESVVRMSPNPIAIITMRGKITSLNSAGLKMLGYDMEEDVLDLDVSSILLDGERAWEKIVWTIEKEGRATGLEIGLVDRSGRKLTGQVYARFAGLAPGKCVEAIFRDVTNQKLMEEQVKEARSESEFLNDLLSHDIINYTISALHFLGTARRASEMKEETREKIDVITRDIQHAFELASSVRDLSRVKMADESTKDEIKDLQLLVTEAIEDSKTMYFDKRTTFNLQRTPEPKFARAGALASRLFANLLSNSIKFDQHEEVVIDVTITAVIQNDLPYWRTDIADRGTGIPDSEKKSIFERFGRSSSKMAGTGLGLFVAKSIAEMYGGSIWAEDRIRGDPARGAKMVVLLPKADDRQIAELRTKGTNASQP